MILCRGRNGWFKYDRHKVVVGDDTEGAVVIDLYSKRKPRTPPVIICGHRPDVKKLLTDMLEKL